VKELHYFDKLDTVRTCLDPKERRRLGFGRLWLLDPWAVHFWLGRRHDAWYARLFEDARRRGLISGEITPAYAILGEDIFRRIKSMNRDSLIFIMQDPLSGPGHAVNNALRRVDRRCVQRGEGHRQSALRYRRAPAYTKTIKP
jgi:hypothetical protein